MERCWRRQCKRGSIARWQRKLNHCMSQLYCWSKNAFKSRGIELECLLHQLGELQYDWSLNLEKIKELSLRIEILGAIKENFWQQRSRVKWLREGDANTIFFH